MLGRPSVFIPLALICVFITSQSNFCNGLMRKLKSEDPISLTCRKTTDFGFCVFTLESDPRSAGATTDVLAHIPLDMLHSHVTNTSNYLQDLLKNATDAKAKEVINTCITSYGVAVDKDVPAALKSLDAKAYGDALTALSAAINDGEGCQDGISGDPSPSWDLLTFKNKYLHDLAQLGTDLIGLLGK